MLRCKNSVIDMFYIAEFAQHCLCVLFYMITYAIRGLDCDTDIHLRDTLLCIYKMSGLAI
jgi:hypothetical protein